MPRPCTLAINNSGAWKALGHFDASDSPKADSAMNAAEQLMKALNEGKPAKQWPTLRISTDDGFATVLMYWTTEHGWHESRRGASA